MKYSVQLRLVMNLIPNDAGTDTISQREEQTEITQHEEDDRILSHKLFLQREYEVSHLEYDREMDFYEAVKEGDLQKLESIMLPLKNEKLGKLSNNPLRNLKYHLVVTVAMITRFCIEGGLPSETAYTLSDISIQKADAAQTEDEIHELHRLIVYDFASKMKSLRSLGGYSRPVIKAIDYIYDHLQEKITLTDIASSSGMQKNYLCALFKKETGSTIFSYVMKLRIEAASNMLTFADYKPADISQYFMFSSHSNFIKAFKKETGFTPAQYRKKYYRKQWTKSIDPS
jgi:AraC family transcriptional regulator